MSLDIPHDGGSDIGPAVVALYELTHILREHCPWDQAQTAATIVPHTLEEVYEVIDAVNDAEWALAHTADTPQMNELVDELGDLLFQVCFLTMWVHEHDESVDLGDIARGIHAKLVRRHPHIFDLGDDPQSASDADEVRKTWEQVKRTTERRGLFEGIPRAMPALARASKVQQRAASIGFDFDAMDAALEKVDEEVAELREAIEAARASGAVSSSEQQPPDAAIAHEIGDVLFATANVSRLARVPAELALGGSTDRFQMRVMTARRLAEESGHHFDELELDEQEQWYQRAKSAIDTGRE